MDLVKERSTVRWRGKPPLIATPPPPITDDDKDNESYRRIIAADKENNSWIIYMEQLNIQYRKKVK
jgi:hypothetical protein